MTREEAIKVLRTESVEIGGNAVSVCRFLEALDMAIYALRQQERFGEANKALTLDELRKMDGEPVWVVWPDGRIKSQWFIISSTFWIEIFQEWDGTLSKDYGKTWLAYRQKPEEGTV